jgi:hypothetical protein
VSLHVPKAQYDSKVASLEAELAASQCKADGLEEEITMANHRITFLSLVSIACGFCQ